MGTWKVTDKNGKEFKVTAESAEKAAEAVETMPSGWLESAGKTVDQAFRNAAQVFPFVDQAAAYVNPMIDKALGLEFPERSTENTFEQNLKSEQEMRRTAHPAVKYPALIGGGLAGAAIGAPVVQGLAKGVGLTNVPRWIAGAISGGIQGAVYNAAEAPSVKEMPAYARTGAIWGTGLGAAAPKVVDVGSRAVKGMWNKIVQMASSGAAKVGNIASRNILRAAMRDFPDMPPEQAMRAWRQKYGALKKDFPDAMPVDAGGENLRGKYFKSMKTPNAGRTGSAERLTKRAKGQLMRLTASLRDLGGTQTSRMEAIQETADALKQKAGPAFKKAVAWVAEGNDEIADAFNREINYGWGKQVWNSSKLKRNLMSEFQLADPKGAPLMTKIDAWRKAINDVIEDAPASNQARVLRKVRDRVIDLVDAANPDYKTARGMWGGHKQFLRAIETGRLQVMKTNIDGQEFKMWFDSLSPADQVATRIGALGSIVGKMAANPSIVPDLTHGLRSPAMRQKIAALMPTEEAAQKWLARLDPEIAGSDLYRKAMGGSPTAPLQAEGQDMVEIGQEMFLDIALDPTGGFGVLKHFLKAGLRGTRDTAQSKAHAEILRILEDPAMADDILGRIAQQGAAVQASTSMIPITPGALVATQKYPERKNPHAR